MKLGRVLVVEDEPFIALDLEAILEEFGATSVFSVDSRTDALQWLATNIPDVAIVDPHVHDGICTDVVKILTAAHVPFVVYSGAVAVPSKSGTTNAGLSALLPMPATISRSLPPSQDCL